MTQFVAIDVGGTLAFWSGDATRIVDDIAEAAPTHLPTVPRLLEKVHTRVLGSATGPRGAIVTGSLAVAERVARRRREGRPISC
jgi:long-chain acyl-CoA synthetase